MPNGKSKPSLLADGMSQKQRDYSWAAHLDCLEGGVVTVRRTPGRYAAWPAGKDDCGASLDSMEGSVASTGAPEITGSIPGWLARHQEFLIRLLLATITLPLVALWWGKHGFWPLTADNSASIPIILSAVAISLAGFAQGLTGFGYGLVAIALLPLLMSLKEAVTLATLLNLVVCVRTFLSLRAHYSWRQGLGLVVGACLGVPLGTYLLIQLDEALLLRVLGGVMLLFSANELLLARGKPFRLSPCLGLPFGLVSGGLSGAFGVGGPPAIAYTYSQSWTKEQVVAVLQIVFGLSALLRLILLGTAGFLSTPLLHAGLWSVIPLLGAISVGQKFFSRISQSVLRLAAFLFLWTMGLKYLLFP